MEFKITLTRTYEGPFILLAAAVWLISGITITKEQEDKDSKGFTALAQCGDTWLLNAIADSKAFSKFLMIPDSVRELHPKGDAFSACFLGHTFLEEVGGVIGLARLRDSSHEAEKNEHLEAFLASKGDTVSDGKLSQLLRDMFKGKTDGSDAKFKVATAKLDEKGELVFDGEPPPPDVVEQIKKALKGQLEA